MNVTFKLDVKDYIDFNYWYGRKGLIIVNVFYAFFITVILSLLFLTSHKNTFLVITDMVLLLMLILLLLYFNAAVYFRSKKIFASDGFLQKEQTYEITPDAITMTTERSSATVLWDEVYLFAESKDAIYIFIAKNKAYLIPKRCMDDAATQELRQLAISNLPPKKVKLRK